MTQLAPEMNRNLVDYRESRHIVNIRASMKYCIPRTRNPRPHTFKLLHGKSNLIGHSESFQVACASVFNYFTASEEQR